MVIVIEESGTVSVSEPDDFTRFHVQASRTTVSGTEFVAAISSRVGRTGTQDRVLVDPDKLRALIGPAAENPNWQQGFERMVAYARTRGWVDGDGLIAAHIEQPSST